MTIVCVMEGRQFIHVLEVNICPRMQVRLHFAITEGVQELAVTASRTRTLNVSRVPTHLFLTFPGTNTLMSTASTSSPSAVSIDFQKMASGMSGGNLRITIFPLVTVLGTFFAAFRVEAGPVGTFFDVLNFAGADCEFDIQGGQRGQGRALRTNLVRSMIRWSNWFARSQVRLGMA